MRWRKTKTEKDTEELSGITEDIKLFPIRNDWITWDPSALEKAAEEGVLISVIFIMNMAEGEVIGVQFFPIVKLVALNATHC